MPSPSGRVRGLRLTRQPQLAQWGVPTAGADLAVVLIGWVVREPAVDAGVPPQAASVLAGTLTRLALLSFLGEPAHAIGNPTPHWHPTTDGWAARWGGATGRGRQQAPLPMIATQDAATASAMFLSDAFDWAQQAQIGVLSAPAAPPEMDSADLHQAIERRDIGDLLRRRHWLGLVYPGVDGDFAAVVSTAPAFVLRFIDELARSCSQAGLALEAVDEAEFERRPWLER